MVRRVVVLGAGTAGTMVANRLRHRLDDTAWDVVVVDQDTTHLYQPGLLLLPFGVYSEQQLVRPRPSLLREGVRFELGEVDGVDPVAGEVHLRDGRRLDYDYLVVASGTQPRPDQTPGMTGVLWRDTVQEFFTLPGAVALRQALRDFTGGRLLVHVTEMPIKCPVAPLEMALLLDAHLTERGLREATQITYVTPLDGAFTRPVASQRLGSLLTQRRIGLESDFVVDHVDDENQRLVSVDDREVPFDLLVTIPLNMGAELVARSGLGDELNYVPVDRHTLLSPTHPNLFAIGDATDLPTSKAGSVAHFEADSFVDNFVDHVHGRPMTRSFDGHANCFVESGYGKALLLDFNYDTEPLPGRYPLPGVGPFSLLAPSRANHWGKLAFRWAYWHLLLPGRPLPVPTDMSMAGKRRVA